MGAEDVKQTLDDAIEFTGMRHPTVLHRPRLLSDNLSCYMSKALKQYLDDERIAHTRGKPRHAIKQGKIERYRQSMKKILLFENYCSPTEPEHQINLFVEHYNKHHYHAVPDNVTPAEMYSCRDSEVLKRQAQVKRKTIPMRPRHNCALMIA